MIGIQAIETRYKGYRFRSRLEARWAVFFDTLGMKWVYEPEGFNLGPAGWYLPDFKVEVFGGAIWIEVKGARPAASESRKCAALHKATGEQVYLISGMHEAFDIDDHSLGDAVRIEAHGAGAAWGLPLDFGYQWCACTDCGSVGLQYMGWAERNYCCEGARVRCHASSRDRGGAHPLIQKAVRAARAARFEHGEKGGRP